MEKIKKHTETVKTKAKQAHGWSRASRRNMVIAVAICFVFLSSSAAGVYYAWPSDDNNSSIPTTGANSSRGNEYETGSSNTTSSTNPDAQAEKQDDQTTQNTGEKSVNIILDNYDSPGTVAKSTSGGAKNTNVNMKLKLQNFELKNCTVTDSITLDDDNLSQTSKSISAVADQELSLVDGKHVITAKCTAGTTNKSDTANMVIMDNQPKKCQDFNFSDGATTASSVPSLQSGMVGTWQGCVTTPWVPKYFVNMTFRSDGTYSAVSGEQLDFRDMNALYYGTEDDNAAKKYGINTFQSGVGTGNIVIWFGDSKTTTDDQLKNIKLMGSKLSFEMLHLNQYGPLTFQLNKQ
jgi:hypothetical protein